MEKFGNRLHLM